jgi:hypothetical protein
LESAHIIQFLQALAKNSSFGFSALAVVPGKTKCAVCAVGFFGMKHNGIVYET